MIIGKYHSGEKYILVHNVDGSIFATLRKNGEFAHYSTWGVDEANLINREITAALNGVKNMQEMVLMHDVKVDTVTNHFWTSAAKLRPELNGEIPANLYMFDGILRKFEKRMTYVDEKSGEVTMTRYFCADDGDDSILDLLP